jgi:rod shape-determining protein MreB
MVIDFGEGVTDCAVLADGYIEASVAVRGGCCALRARVIAAIQRETGFILSEAEAERLIRHVGLRQAGRRLKDLVVAQALSANSTLPRRQSIPGGVIADAVELGLGEALDATAAFVKTIERRRFAEVFETGVLLTGGGALIPGVSARFADRLGLPVTIAPAPLDSVINGAREMLSVAADARVWRNR